MFRIIWLVMSFSVITSVSADALTVGIEGIDYAPYYSTHQSRVEGAAPEVLEKFASTNGHALEMLPLPVARLLPTFLNKDVEFKFPDNANWAADKKGGMPIYYSDPVFQFTDGTIVKLENKGKGVKKLGILRGFTAWDYLDKVKSGEVSVVEGSSLEGLVKMLNAGRIDGLYFNVDVASNVIRKTLGSSDSMVFDETLPHTTSDYHLSSHGNQKIIDEFNAFMKANNDFIKAVKEKYGIF